MPELRLRWIVAGDVQLDRSFTRLALDVDDFEDPLRETGAIIYAEVRHQFAAQGDPDWPALSRAYAARKAKRYPGKPMMVASGDLLASLTDSDAEGAIYELSPTHLRMGTDIQVGKWNLGLIHQKPETSKLPARPMLRLRESAKLAITDTFRKWFIKLAEQHDLDAR